MAYHQNSLATVFRTSSRKPSALAQGKLLLDMTISEMVKIRSMDAENHDFLHTVRSRFDELQQEQGHLGNCTGTWNPFKQFANNRNARTFCEAAESLYLETKVC
ncbi:hypothetical protein V8E55_005072 [Tylopilus felleus]